jgi:CubicO group peptidase (beta-lactamase class C family)
MPQTSPISLDPARLQRAVAVAEDAVRSGPYPSAVIAVANAETTLLTHTVSHPERAPVREDGIFLLASITKPIVATAIMRLVEEGRLLLTDPVVKYIPEFELFGKGRVTAWHLLTHTSGLDESAWWREMMFGQRATADDLVQMACTSALRFEPGTRYEYNTLAFVILGELIARLSGLTYPEYLNQQIFEPLGMRDTSFAPSGAQQSRAIRVYAPPSDPDGDRRVQYFTTVAAPGGGLWSTAADLVRFGQALLRGGRSGDYHLLSPAAIDVMTRLHTGGLLEIVEDKPAPASYGLGWGKPGADGKVLASPRAYEHGGATGTRLHIDPEWDLVFVFLTNQWGIEANGSQRALNAVYGALRRD